jgi:hypothetical protein
MAKDYTPEPWTLMDNPCEAFICSADRDGDLIVAVVIHGNELANARRIVACVNACAGLNPEAVPKLVTAFSALIDLAERLGVPIERYADIPPELLDARAVLAEIKKTP